MLLLRGILLLCKSNVVKKLEIVETYDFYANVRKT